MPNVELGSSYDIGDAFGGIFGFIGETIKTGTEQASKYLVDAGLASIFGDGYLTGQTPGINPNAPSGQQVGTGTGTTQIGTPTERPTNLDGGTQPGNLALGMTGGTIALIGAVVLLFFALK